jgi:hypothetical protein
MQIENKLLGDLRFSCNEPGLSCRVLGRNTCE